jgi:hypothetical protein
MKDPGNNVARKSFIKIENIDAKGPNLIIDISVSDDIKKYFNTLNLYVTYDKSIEKNEKGILAIPALSSIIPIAWATGSDVYVDTIDQAFLDSMLKVEKVFKTWFPQFKFDSLIHANNISVNNFNNKGYALLFSGGLDSVTSYINNKEKKPQLISIWGADIPVRETDFWKVVEKHVSEFASDEKIQCRFIKTNLRESINDVLLTQDYGTDWWLMVSHGLMLAGSTAPLLTDGIGTLLIASTHTDQYDKPNGSHLFLNTPMYFGNISVRYDLGELNRQEKIRYVLKRNKEYGSNLRVCGTHFNNYNCSICEKCLRTITALVLDDIDPAGCNFNVNDKTFKLIKNLIKGNLVVSDDNTYQMWKDIRDNIPDDLDDKMYNSKEFFIWLKKFDLSNCDRRVNAGYRRLLRHYYLMEYIGISRILYRNQNKLLKSELAVAR